MSKMEKNGMEKLAKVLDSRMVEHSGGGFSFDFGVIKKDYSLVRELKNPAERGNRCNGYLLLKRGFPLFISLLLNYNPMNRTNNLYQIPYLCNLAIQFQHND